MKFFIKRETIRAGVALGSLLVDDEFVCHTCESLSLPQATRAHLFSLTMQYSPIYSRCMPMLSGPTQQEAWILPGHRGECVNGHILVGLVRGSNLVYQQRAAFGRVMAMLERALAQHEDVQLEIVALLD